MRKEYENDRVLYGLAALAGALAFVMIYGINVLNPVYDDWLLGQGDLTQHYLGWCFYRRGSWTFPIGLTDNLAYPSYTSVIFTDSIPLLLYFLRRCHRSCLGHSSILAGGGSQVLPCRECLPRKYCGNF